jgi:polar amino acid transport system permease protein
MLKATSLVSVISLAELLYSAQSIYSQNFETIALLVVVTIWYLALTTVFTFVFGLLERRAAKAGRHLPSPNSIRR